ncbi:MULTISPECIES: globin family protein [unclassified Variovorax]|uniref:globin family protein n=1 Tax=unclassified Variovorax TaxID=663243 RepID=UPI001BD48078|nr:MULTISPECIES: globin family protein [unclassified Variovorax]
MTPNQIELVQSSFAKVVPISEQAAAIFYGRLFELAPEVRALFKGDMVEQGRKLMTMLGGVTRGLGNLDTLVPVAQRLAERHVGYGAEPAHYAVVGAALIDTLDKGLGAEFTPDVRNAWETAYGTLSGVMIAAARKTAEGSAMEAQA